MSEAASEKTAPRVLAPIPTPRAGRRHTVLTSLTKKYAVAVSGLALVLFLVAHLAGNLLIFAGPSAFDEYAHLLESNPVLPLAEVGLFAVFVLHVALAITCARINRQAKPQKYAVSATRGESSIASRTMLVTGLLVLAFVIFHIAHLKLGHKFQLFGHPGDIPLSRWMLSTLAEPLVAFVYLIGVSVVGLHVSHGAWSGLQTLGWNNKLIHPRLFALARLFAALLTAGFGSIVIYALIGGGR